MTHYTHADLEIADQHVAQAERHVVQQEALITRLRMQARPTDEADELLEVFISTLAGHRDYRASVVKALTFNG